jgi:hypothetical protein
MLQGIDDGAKDLEVATRSGGFGSANSRIGSPSTVAAVCSFSERKLITPVR